MTKKVKRYREKGPLVECLPPPDKQCTRCNRKLPISEFRWRSDESGWTLNCNSCRADNANRQQTWRDGHPKEAYIRSKASSLRWRTKNPELHSKREKQAYVDRCKKPGYKKQEATKQRAAYVRLKEGDPIKYAKYLKIKREKRKILHAKRKAERDGC